MRDARVPFGLLGIGALLAVGLALLRGMSAGSWPGRGSIAAPVAAWLADRDGCAVYGLDEDCILAMRVHLDWPIAVAGLADGGAWILRSTRGVPGGPSRLLRLDAEGLVRSEIDLGACAGVAALDDGSAIVIEFAREGDGGDRVLRCDEAGDVETLYRGRSLTCVTNSRVSIDVGDSRGIVRRVSLDPIGVVVAEVDLRERVVQMESVSVDGRVWVLTSAEHATIHRLDADLVLRWSRGAGSGTTSLASDDDPERIWLIDGGRSMVRRLDEVGVVEFERGEIPIFGPSRATRDSRGGLLISSPGCLLHLDSEARIRPGQGGFAHLVDVDRVP